MQLFYVYTTFMLFVTFATANPVADSVAVEALVEVAKIYANMGKKNSDTGQHGMKITESGTYITWPKSDPNQKEIDPCTGPHFGNVALFECTKNVYTTQQGKYCSKNPNKLIV